VEIFAPPSSSPSENRSVDESHRLSVDFSSHALHTPGMSTALPPKPRIVGPKVRICIVASKYNEQFTDALVENTIEELGDLVPQDRDPPACIIALGVIIRGATEHAEMVASSVTYTLQQLAVQSMRPVIHEVLLVADEKQAYARCIGAQLNRGREAARAAAAMIDVFLELDRSMPRNASFKKNRNA
jgi:6,7-dimethyl-8-ribityllumazine synthase